MIFMSFESQHATSY